MATAMIAPTTQTHKPAKAFYAILYHTQGTLTKLDGTIYFFSEHGELIEVEPDMCNFLTVLGECGLADAARCVDEARGGLAKIACRRAN